MRRLLMLVTILLICANAISIIVETASFTEFLYGVTEDCEYDNWVSHVSEGIANEGYNLYSPWEVQADSFGTFVLPDDVMLNQWQNVVDAFLLQDYIAVQAWLNIYDFPYNIVEFHDTDSGNIYYMLREILNPEYYDSNGTISIHDDEIGSFDYGWGLFVHNPQAISPIIVTVPHPNDDFITPVIGYKCFSDWDAKFLLISGAGREVFWDGYGSYTNSHSLCDPSRNNDVAFNTAYRSFCDDIRDEYGQREFSAQIHSYDWNRHDNHPDCQISAMSDCPNLPIRDLSNLHLDMINASQHITIPQNTIGSNNEVLLNDYYSANYSIYDFLFYNWDGEPYEVNDNVDLPGYSGNKQRLYSYQDWNEFDVFDPFFHIEMDELPGSYDETQDNYNWFYGFDPESNSFQMDRLFDNTLEYYSIWVDAMTDIVHEAMELDDGLTPPTPRNFTASYIDHNSIDLVWNAVSSYDFHTYELLFADNPITPVNHTLINRENLDTFASPLNNTYSLTSLNMNDNYYFQIRSIDKNGNSSILTEQLEVFTAPAHVDDLTAIGLDSEINIKWTAVQQNGNMGFNIYRKQQNDEFVLIDSWTNNFLLSGTQNLLEEYSYIDNNLDNGVIYTYKISSENENGDEFPYEQLQSCSPSNYFNIFVSNSSFTIVDSVTFAKNQYAHSWQDPEYDIVKNMELPDEYVFSAFYESSWIPGGMYLQQEVHGDFSPRESYRIWNLRVKTNQLDQPIEIFVNPEFIGNNGNLFLQNLQTDQFTNMVDGSYIFFAEDSVYYDFKLYWGNLHPYVISVYSQTKLNRGGDEMTIVWNPQIQQLIEYFDISLQNEDTSILISDHVNRFDEEFIWEIPEQTEIDKAKIVIRAHAVDGQIFEKQSNEFYGVIPLEYTLEYTQGWQLITNPWCSDELFLTSDVFSANSELLEFDQHLGFSDSDEFQFGNGYWLNASSEGSYTNSGSVITSDNYNIPLQSGWNLIPNPYLCSYEPHNLIIINSGEYSSYRDAVLDKLIANVVYVYRDNKFMVTNVIKPHEAFYFYVNNEYYDNMEIRFTPYFVGYYNIPEVDWKVTLTAFQTDGDEIIVGCSEFASDNFDNEYDVPEPPAKPVQNGITMYIPKHSPADSLFLYPNLNCEIKSSLETGISESKLWNFILEVHTLDAVTLEFDMLNLPEGYHADIQIDGNSWNQLTNENYIYSFIPSQIGMIDGYIEICNNVASAEEIISKAYDFVNFPNPFNPSTKIRFNVPQEGNVELSIYNIKGQKVKTLCDQILSSGNHEYVWDGKNNSNSVVASGIYFLNLKTHEETRIKKVLLLK
ncbi:MAG: T9SS type A sorting domain-containing protein [Candidatus Tenebribacter mawsonii]|nr:T9SS type A sorting domain-containing protein [Candidatus Tenebribacter mawsonii]